MNDHNELFDNDGKNENEIINPPNMEKPAEEKNVAEEPAAEQDKDAFFKEEIRNYGEKRKRGKFRRTVALVCIASILGGSALGIGIGIGGPLANKYIIPKLLDDSKQVESFKFPDSEAQAVGAFSDQESVSGYADVVNKVKPSVVTITSNIEGEQQFFNFSMPYEGTGAGTGILFSETDSNYYIVTNAHVIDGAKSVQVSIEGSDEKFSAKLVGKDSDADLAVITITKADVKRAGIDNVVLASFGDSDSMQVGDVVLAIGNSLGDGNTVTNGILSSKEKEITIDGKTLTVLQTNAAINQGNSGGPLVNLKGEVVGINTAKLSQASNVNVEGTGYAIPSNVAKPIIEQLMQQSGRPILGIRGRNLSEDEAQHYNLPQAGVMIVEVDANYPAQKAGLKVNDVITGIDDEPVLSMDQLIETLSKHKAEDKVDVKIIRDGKDFMTIKTTLAENTMENF